MAMYAVNPVGGDFCQVLNPDIHPSVGKLEDVGWGLP